MQLARIQTDDGTKHVALVEGDVVKLLDMTQVENCKRLSDILHAPDPFGLTRFLVDQKAEPLAAGDVRFLPPVDYQEVWAAGVTYKRSQQARMEESEHGASHYDQVYDADRPELFFKSTPARLVGNGDYVRIRDDSSWSVPEPEYALMLSPTMKICGYTIGNDMSSRDIEGENPLYLPQAKVYDQSCALGPVVTLAEGTLKYQDVEIQLQIMRDGEEVFSGQTLLNQLHRTLEDLASWLGRQMSFPAGAVLLTGTGIIPPDDFTLEAGDEVAISISNIGTLTNSVVQGKI